MSHQAQDPIPIEPHLFTALKAADTSLHLLDLLPEIDIVSEIVNTLAFQLELFDHLITGKHMGTERINQMINILEETRIWSIKMLKDQESREL